MKSEREQICEALGLIPTADLNSILLRIETLRIDQRRWWRVEDFVQRGAPEREKP